LDTCTGRTIVPAGSTVVQTKCEPAAWSVPVTHTVVRDWQYRSPVFRFSDVSRVKLKLLIRFWFYFRLCVPYTYLYHILQKNSCFSHPKTTYSKSLIITNFPKSLKLAFHTKTQVSSQILCFDRRVLGLIGIIIQILCFDMRVLSLIGIIIQMLSKCQE
jgi:hypothetical protein